MQQNHFLFVKAFKNTDLPSSEFEIQDEILAVVSFAKFAAKIPQMFVPDEAMIVNF